MPIVAIPHIDSKRQVRRNVVQVRIGEFAQQFVNAKV